MEVKDGERALWGPDPSMLPSNQSKAYTTPDHTTSILQLQILGLQLGNSDSAFQVRTVKHLISSSL